MALVDKFAKERYCDQCDKTVPVVFRDKTVAVPIYGERVELTYKQYLNGLKKKI